MLKKLSEIASFAQTLLTIAGIFAALWWFWAQAESSRKANITPSITHKKIDNELTWILISVEIVNVGKRPIKLRNGDIRLKMIYPVNISINDRIKDGLPSLVNKDTHTVPWPILEENPVKISADVYPGETHTIYYESVIPAFLESLELYIYFAEKNDWTWESVIAGEKNDRKWESVIIYDIPKK